MRYYCVMNTIVVAYDRLRTIGRHNQLPWQGVLPADMAHFKKITDGQSVVMGRRTFDSLPEQYRPLPNRQNIVLSLSHTAINGVIVVHSLKDAYEASHDAAYVIGGSQIYQQALSTVNRIIATEIDTETTDGDAFFPTIDTDEWDEADRISFEADEVNKFAYSFVTYLRRQR